MDRGILSDIDAYLGVTKMNVLPENIRFWARVVANAFILVQRQ